MSYDKRAADAAYYAANRERVLRSVAANKARNPEKYKRLNRASWYRTKFNISLDDYEMMVELQDGCCAMCGQPETAVNHRSGEIQNLAVDHDHACCPGDKSCGACVRGLLCRSCNQALGVYERIREAAQSYLGRAR